MNWLGFFWVSLNEHKQSGDVLKPKKTPKQGHQKGQDPGSGRGADTEAILRTQSFRITWETAWTHRE